MKKELYQYRIGASVKVPLDGKLLTAEIVDAMQDRNGNHYMVQILIKGRYIDIAWLPEREIAGYTRQKRKPKCPASAQNRRRRRFMN